MQRASCAVRQLCRDSANWRLIQGTALLLLLSLLLLLLLLLLSLVMLSLRLLLLFYIVYKVYNSELSTRRITPFTVEQWRAWIMHDQKGVRTVSCAIRCHIRFALSICQRCTSYLTLLSLGLNYMFFMRWTRCTMISFCVRNIMHKFFMAQYTSRYESCLVRKTNRIECWTAYIVGRRYY